MNTMLGSTIVIMNNIILNNVVEVEVKKNMMNMNPRGIIDAHLDGNEFMPGTAIVRTTSNVEDFFRLNTPLIIANKTNNKAEIAQALAAVSYMPTMSYNDKLSAVKILGVIAAGFIPVFIGVCAGFQAVYVNSADYVGYEYIIGGFDLSVFLMQPYNNDPVSFVADKLLDKNYKYENEADKPNFTIPPQYLVDTDINSAKAMPVVGRQPFVCTAIAEFLSKSPQYLGYMKETNSFFKIIKDIATPIVSGMDAAELPRLLALKQAASLKVPVNKFEANVEAIPVGIVKNLIQWSAAETPKPEDQWARLTNMNWAYMLGLFTPQIFYETFVREDTGEFVFRRAGWINRELGIPRQKFQNPYLQIIVPKESVMTHQKMWGGKMGEIPLLNAYGQISINYQGYQVVGITGKKNQAKFGNRALDKNVFDNLDTSYVGGNKDLESPYNPIQFTDVFCSNDYYRIPDAVTVKTMSPPGDVNISDRAKETLPKMLSWAAKYHHTYPYVLFVGFNSYFMAPLGSAVQVVLPPSPATLAGLGQLAKKVTVNDPFTSIEAASSYRVVGKIYRKAMRQDGSYSEEYYLLLGNAAPGFDMKK